MSASSALCGLLFHHVTGELEVPRGLHHLEVQGEVSESQQSICVFHDGTVGALLFPKLEGALKRVHGSEIAVSSSALVFAVSQSFECAHKRVFEVLFLCDGDDLFKVALGAVKCVQVPEKGNQL